MIKTETEETIRKICANYQPKEISNLERLKALDRKVKRPVEIFAYVYGSLASLVLGMGMCFAMEVIGSSMVLGTVLGIVGIALTLTTYPIYKAILKRRKNKYAEQICELADGLLNK